MFSEINFTVSMMYVNVNEYKCNYVVRFDCRFDICDFPRGDRFAYLLVDLLEFPILFGCLCICPFFCEPLNLERTFGFGI